MFDVSTAGSLQEQRRISYYQRDRTFLQTFGHAVGSGVQIIACAEDKCSGTVVSGWSTMLVDCVQRPDRTRSGMESEVSSLIYFFQFFGGQCYWKIYLFDFVFIAGFWKRHRGTWKRLWNHSSSWRQTHKYRSRHTFSTKCCSRCVYCLLLYLRR